MRFVLFVLLVLLAACPTNASAQAPKSNAGEPDDRLSAPADAEGILIAQHPRGLSGASRTSNAVVSRNEGTIAYIKIPAFNAQTHAQLIRAVAKAESTLGDALQGYIIDLRDNPGGLLDPAVAVADELLESGVIVRLTGRGDDVTRRTANPGDLTQARQLVVLINANSAAAAEIVAGALQDHKRATVIGTRSSGWGIIQSLIPLDDNGAIRLTTGRSSTPSGRAIEGAGIDPDVVVEQEATVPAADASSAEAPGENDTQLQHALRFIRATHKPDDK